MGLATNTTAGERTVRAFFDTSGAAKQAVDDLVAAGIPRQNITETGGHDGPADSPAGQDPRGFWDALKDFFLPDADRQGYAEGLSRGGHLLSVRTDQASYDRVLDILDTDGAVDMDEREKTWRSEGWNWDLSHAGSVLATSGPTSGIVAGTGLLRAADDAKRRDGQRDDTRAATGDDAMARADALDTSVAATAAAARRDDTHGRSRLRSYVRDADASGESPAGSFSPERDRQNIVAHMDVIAADGQSIGQVDHLDGPDRIKLTKSSSPDGQHHVVPFAWIDHVDQHVHLKKTLAEIKSGA